MSRRFDSDFDYFARLDPQGPLPVPVDPRSFHTAKLAPGVGLFVQTWRYRESSVTFNVLAYPDHANECGRIRLAGMSGADAPMVRDTVLMSQSQLLPLAHWVEAVLAVEDEQEKWLRDGETKYRADGV